MIPNKSEEQTPAARWLNLIEGRRKNGPVTITRGIAMSRAREDIALLETFQMEGHEFISEGDLPISVHIEARYKTLRDLQN